MTKIQELAEIGQAIWLTSLCQTQHQQRLNQFMGDL